MAVGAAEREGPGGGRASGEIQPPNAQRGLERYMLGPNIRRSKG